MLLRTLSEVTVVCVLVKLRWPKEKSIYDKIIVMFANIIDVCCCLDLMLIYKIVLHQVYCDMTPGSEAWTLIARFSNKDIAHWMNDSGYWWYDRTEAAGKTTDPLTNADMISSVFWLVSGNELKITRSDDTHHTPLLQTTGDCLGGQTFRAKITSYGDFKSGKAWEFDQCLGSCTVQYGGQYNTTEGFINAGVNGTLQSFNRIGFWCNSGWGSFVLMIGGGGIRLGNCTNCAGHGLGVTAAKQPYFVREEGRPEKDFANDQWGYSTREYALNLWIRG